MATWQSDYDEYIKNNSAATQKKITEQQTANTNISNQYVEDVNAIVDQNISNSVNKVQGEIDKLPTAYQSSFDANAIQQKINERQVAEQMANLGLTNSGLNRTQQTAIAVQRSNADAALRQQMNAATASLKQQIADIYASGETQKMQTAADAKYQLAQSNQSVYNTYMDNLYSSAETYANNEATNRATLEKARIEAEQEQRNQLISSAKARGFAYNEDGSLTYIGTDNENEQEKIKGAISVFKDAGNYAEADEALRQYLIDNYSAYGYSDAEVNAIYQNIWANYGYLFGDKGINYDYYFDTPLLDLVNKEQEKAKNK